MPLSPAELQQREAEDAIADQQRTAERQAKQADREQKAAADAARKADLSRQELEFRAQGMIPVTTADGNLHADPLFEQKQADKAAKEQAKAAKESAALTAKQQRADLTRQGVRHAINPIDGTPIPFETADDVARRRTEAAQQRRNQKLDDEIRAADADHDFQLADYESKGFKPLSRGADGTRPLETKALPKLKQDALFALQTRLQEQAKAVSGDADWIPFNEAATPEAQTAKQRLEALSQPGAELSEDDLAELEANDATKPLVARIRGIQTQLAKDDEINTLTTSHKSRIASLKLKRANPEKWFETERQRRASLPPDQLEADLETSRADLDARRADLETRSATLNGQLQLWNQKLETLEAQAAERRQRGLMASEIVTYTREDGTTEDWPRDLAAQREQITAQAQNTHALQQDDWAELQLQDQDWQREAALLAEAAERLQTTRQEQAQTAKTQFSNRLRFTPGMEQTAGELEAIQSEADLRAQDLADMHPDGVPEEAQQALQDDIQQRQQASLAAGQQRQQAAAAAYQGLQSALLPDKNGNTKADSEVRPTVIANLAEALQVDPQEAERLLSDMETLNWDAESPQDRKEKTPADFAAKTKALRDSSNLTGFASALAQTAGDIWTDKPSDPRQTRLLSNGAVVVNPQITAEKDYTAAVNASSATPEAKADALDRFPDIRHNAGAQVRQSFQELEGVYGKEWVKDWLEYDAKRPQDVSPEEWAMRFTEDRKNDSALRRVAQEIGWSFYKGGNQLRQQVSGLAGGITGSETAMQDATWAGRKAQAMQTSKELYGSASDNFLRAGLLEMTPEVATSIIPAAGGAKLAQLGIRGLAATGAGARLFPALAAVLEGSSTAAQAVKATQTLTRAGLAGASLAGGAQTYGSQLSEIYGNLRRQGIEHPDALRMAQTPAILSAGVTAALTALGGASGVERLLVNPASAKALFAKQFETQLKRIGFVGQKFVEGGLREFALEELPDEMFSAWQSGVASHPDDPAAGRKALAEFLKTLPEFAIATGVLGGAGEGISSYQESSVLPAMHLRPETVATAWSAIENHRAFTPDGVEDPNVTVMEQQRATTALYLAQGGDISAIEEGDLNAVGYTRDGTKYKPLKGYSAPPVLDIDSDGTPVIKDSYVATLNASATLAPVAKAIGMTETETRNFYAQRDQPQPAGQNQPGSQQPQSAAAKTPAPDARGSTAQSPVQAPAGKGTQPPSSGSAPAQPGDAVNASDPASSIQQPESPAGFLANHFTERGLAPDQAQTVAEQVTARPEFAGMSYEQIIAEGPKFRAALDDLGIDGSLNSKDVATNPLKVQPGSKLAKVKAEMEAKAAAAKTTANNGQPPARNASRSDAGGTSTAQPSTPLPPAVQAALDDAIPGTPSQAVFAAVKQAVQAKEMTEQQAAEVVAQQSGAQDHTELRQSLELKLGWNPTRANTAAALHFGDKSKSDIPLAAGKKNQQPASSIQQPGRAGPDQSWQDPASPLRKHRAWTTEKLRVLSSLRRPAAPAKGASASAQKKYQKALRAFESKQAWTREVFRLLENDIAKHHAFIEAIALGKTARQHLDGNSAAITVIGGKVTLAIDADALIANISDLESPQDRIEATFNEEYIHVAQKKLEALDPQNYGRDALIKKWDALPDALRKAVWTSYRNANQRAKSAKDARLPATLSAGQKYHLMQEFNRMLVQDKDFAGKITETVDPASGILDWVKSMLQKLGDILREMITRLPKAQQTEIQEHVRRVSDLYQQLASASQGTSAERIGSIPTVTDHQAVATQALTHFMSAKDGIFQPAALAKIWDLLDPSLQRLVFRSKDRDPVTGRFGQQIASRAPKHDLMRDLLAMTATDPKMALAVQEALLKPGTQATKSLNLLERLFTAFSKQTAQQPAPAVAASPRSKSPPLPVSPSSPLLAALSAQSPDARRALATLHSQTLGVLADLIGVRFVIQLPQSPAIQAMLEAEPPQPEDEQKAAAGDKPAQVRLQGRRWLLGQMRLKAPGTPPPSLPVSQSQSLPPPAPGAAKQTANRQYVADLLALLQQQEAADLLDASFTERRAALDAEDAADHGEASTNLAGAKLRAKLRLQQLATVRARFFRQDNAVRELHLAGQAGRQDVEKAASMAALGTGRIGLRRTGGAWRTIGFTERRQLALLGIGVDQSSSGDQGGYPYTLSRRGMAEARVEFSLEGTPERQIAEEELDWMKEQDADYQTAPDDTSPAYVQNSRENWTRSLSTQGTDHILLKQEALDDLALSYPHTAALIRPEHAAREGFGIPSTHTRRPITQGSTPAPTTADALTRKPAPAYTREETPTFTPLAENQSPFAERSADTAARPTENREQRTANLAFAIPLSKRGQVRRAQFPDADSLAAFQFKLDADAVASARSTPTEVKKAEQRGLALLARLMEETGRSRSDLEKKLIDYHTAVVQQAESASAFGTFTPPTFASVGGQTSASADSTLPAPVGGDILSGMREQGIRRLGPPDTSDGWAWYRELQSDAARSKLKNTEAQRLARAGDITDAKAKLAWIDANLVSQTGGRSIDEAAAELNESDAQQFPVSSGEELGRAILDALDARLRFKQEGTLQQQEAARAADATASAQDFATYAAGTPGQPFTVEQLTAELEPEDEIQIGSEWFTVQDTAPLTLDSARFGSVTPAPGSTLNLSAGPNHLRITPPVTNERPDLSRATLDAARAELRAALQEAGLAASNRLSDRLTPAIRVNGVLYTDGVTHWDIMQSYVWRHKIPAWQRNETEDRQLASDWIEKNWKDFHPTVEEGFAEEGKFLSREAAFKKLLRSPEGPALKQYVRDSGAEGRTWLDSGDLDYLAGLPVSSSPPLASSPRIRSAAATYADNVFHVEGKRTFPDFLAYVAGDLPDLFPTLKTPHLRSAWNTLMAEKGLREITPAEEAAALRALAPQVERRYGEMPPDIAAKQESVTPESMGIPTLKLAKQAKPVTPTDLLGNPITDPKDEEDEADPKDKVQNRGSTELQRLQAIDEVYGPLAPGVEVMETKNQDGDTVPHIMRGRGLMLSVDGQPHVAIRSVALPSVGSGHAPGVRFFPLAGDKSNWTGHINKAIQIADPQLDEHTDVYIEPYGGGLVYLQNLEVLLKTSKPVLIASSQEFEPDRNLIFNTLKNGDAAAIADLRSFLTDINHAPQTDAGEALFRVLYDNPEKRRLNKATEAAAAQLPKLIALLQRPNVKILPWNDVQTFEKATAMARTGKRVTLLEDSNYADLYAEGTQDQYKGIDTHPDMFNAGKITNFIGKDPKKLLAQKLPVYRAVLDAGGTVIATNNMNPDLINGLLAEFGDTGHWFGFAHRTRPVPDGFMRHPDGKGVLWSTERPEYLAILQKGVVNPPAGAPKYGTDTPAGLDFRKGARRSLEEIDRAAQPRRTPSPHTGGSLKAAQSLLPPADTSGRSPDNRPRPTGNAEPRTPVIDATLAGGPNWDRTTSAKVAQELDQDQSSDPLDESPEVEAIDYEAQLQEDADRFRPEEEINEDTILSASARKAAQQYRQPDGSYRIPNALRGIGAKPNDAGVAGKGPYYTLKEHVAKMYAGKDGKVISATLTLRKPLLATYGTLVKLQKRLYGRMLTGFEPELSQQFDIWMRQKGYDGAILYEEEEMNQPAEIVTLAASNRQRFPLERALAPTTGTSALFKPNTPPPVAGKQSAVAGSEPPTANRQPLTDHHALLQQAFAQAVLGSSSQWLPIRTVWDQFHAQNPAVTPAAFMRSVKAGDDAGTVFLSPPESAATVEAAGPFKLRNASGIMSTDMMVPLATSKRTTKPQQTSGFLAQKGVAWQHGESRLIQGLARADAFKGTGIGLVPVESEKPETYTRAGRSIPPYTERADLNDLVAEEGALIARAKAEGFFWDKPQVDQLTASLGDSGGGTEHDVYITGEESHLVVIRSTILDSYGFRGRSPAQYLQRLQNYNTAFPGIQTRVIGVSRNTRGNGVIWTAQPFVEGVELKDDKRLQSLMEAKGWVRIDGPDDDNIVYRHTPTGAIIRDAHTGNILVKGQELFPIDVIVTNLGSLAASDRTYSAAIEATGLAPAIKVNGRIYTGHRGMWHPEIIGHYVWKNVFTPQQRRDDPAPHFKASKYAMEEWMDSKGSGFEDFGFVDLPTGDFVDRQEAYRRLVARGVPIPPESWTARNQELDSAEILNIAAALPSSDRIQHPASSIQQQVAAAAAATDPSPTDAQKDAENYKTGKVDVHGLRLSIENPAGSVRSGTDASGKPWSVTLPHHYGRILGTVGRDKEHLDFFLGPNPDSQLVLIINQRKPGNGHFDEHKLMLGFNTPAEAARGYMASYTKGWQGLQSAVPTTIPVFKHWLTTKDTTQPVTKEQIEKLSKTVPLPQSAHDKPAVTEVKPVNPVPLASSDRKPSEYADTNYSTFRSQQTRISKLEYQIWSSYSEELADLLAKERHTLALLLYPAGKEDHALTRAWLSKIAKEITRNEKNDYPAFITPDGRLIYQSESTSAHDEGIHRQFLTRLGFDLENHYYEDIIKDLHWVSIVETTDGLSLRVPSQLPSLQLRELKKIIATAKNAKGRIISLIADGPTSPFVSDTGNLAEFESWLQQQPSANEEAPLQYEHTLTDFALYHLTPSLPVSESPTHDTTLPVTKEQIDKLAKTVPLPQSAHDQSPVTEVNPVNPVPLTSAEVADQIVNDPTTDEWLDTYTGNGWEDAEREFPGGAAKIAALLNRLAPRKHTAPLYRGINPAFGEVQGRPFYSYSFSRESAQMAGREITIKNGPTPYLSLEDIALARIRRDGRSHYAGMQQEVLVPSSPRLPVSPSPSLAASLRQRITTADARLNTLPGVEPGARLLDKATTGAGNLANRIPQAIAGTLNAVTGLGQHLPGQQALAALGPKLGAADQSAAAALGNKIADGLQRVSGKDVRKAPDAVAAWLQQPAGLGAWTKNVVVDQLLPNAMLPREFLALTHEMQRKAAFGTEKSNDLIRALSGNPRLSDLAYPKQFAENMMYREQMFDAMEGRFPMASLPPEMQRLAERLRNLLKETGAELVRQGIMHPDTFAELQTNGWMPRYTLDEAMESGGSVLAAFKLGVKDLLQQRSTAYHIVDTARKGKDGQPPTVNRREGGRNAWRFRDAASRDAFYHDFVRQQTLDMLQEGGNKVVADMLAPLSRGDRAAMRSQIKTLTTDQIANTAKLSPMLAGIVKQAKKHQYDRFLSKDPFEPEKLIKDPVYAIARYVLAQTHNAATMELLRETAKHPEWVSDVALQGFTEIPDADRFGPLAGKFVQADIAAQILDKLDIPNAALRFYDAILRKWKSGKLVWNPGSHIRDAVGNTVFAYLGGSNIFNPGNWPYYQKALQVMRNGGPLYTELIENAVLGGDAYSSLVRERLKGLLPDAKTVENFNPGLLQRLFFDFGAKFHATHEQLAEYRRVPDDFYKIAAYLKAKDSMSAPEAAAHVRKWFPYYDRLGGSATTRAAGRFINPFLSFFRESTRILATAAVERPIALGAALAFPAAISALSAMLLGLDDRDREEIAKDLSGRGKGILGLGGLHLFSMLLPVRSSQGQVQQFDISAIMPFADLLGQKIVPLEEKENAWQTFWRQTAAAGPVGNLGVAWITNRDLFSGRHLVEADMSTREMLGAYTQHTAGVMLPPLLPDAAAAVGIGDGGALTRAGTRQVNKTLATYDPVQTIIRSVFGMNVKSAAPNLYRQADDFRAANGYDVQPGFDYGTTVTSRAKRLLVQQLAQDTPNPQAIANLVKRLKTLGVPMDTEGDIAKTLSIIDPAALIGGSKKAGLSAEDARQRFRQSLPPESRTIYEAALSEFQRIKRRAPMLIRQAQ